MCRYCSYRQHDGWTALLSYDETYQSTMSTTSESTYGFHESWDDLQDDLEFGD